MNTHAVNPTQLMFSVNREHCLLSHLFGVLCEEAAVQTPVQGGRGEDTARRTGEEVLPPAKEGQRWHCECNCQWRDCRREVNSMASKSY